MSHTNCKAMCVEMKPATNVGNQSGLRILAKHTETDTNPTAIKMQDCTQMSFI